MIGSRKENAGASRQRHPFAAVWLLALTALGSTATSLIYGFRQTPPGDSYHGFIMLSEDGSQYLAAIRQGAQGLLLFRDQFTTRPVPPIFMYPLYMWAGRLFAPLHLAPAIVFDILHVAAAIGLVAATWVFARTFAPRNARVAYAFTLFGASLTLLPIALSGGRSVLPYLTGDLGTMQALLFSPHECAGLAAQALCLVAYHRLHGPRRATALLVSLGFLGCTYPFTLPIMLAVLALDTLWNAIDVRCLTPDALVILVVLAPLLSLIPAYYWIEFHTVPYWRESAFLRLPVSHSGVLQWTFGALTILALPRLWSRSARPLMLWVLVTIIFMVANVAQPARASAGLWLPLAVLAADTVGRLRAPSLRTGLVCCLSASGLLMPFFLSDVVAQNLRYPIFQSQQVDAVGRYLAAHANARDVVLADYEISNMLVGEAPVRIVAGHGFQTIDLGTAGPAQARYPLTSAGERQAIERQYGVTYLVVARTERGLVADVARDRRYRQLYTNDGYCLYRVEQWS